MIIVLIFFDTPPEQEQLQYREEILGRFYGMLWNLTAYYEDNGQFPENCQSLIDYSKVHKVFGLQSDEFAKICNSDRWGNPFVFINTTHNNLILMIIIGYGPDGNLGTSDDLILMAIQTENEIIYKSHGCYFKNEKPVKVYEVEWRLKDFSHQAGVF